MLADGACIGAEGHGEAAAVAPDGAVGGCCAPNAEPIIAEGPNAEAGCCASAAKPAIVCCCGCLPGDPNGDPDGTRASSALIRARSLLVPCSWPGDELNTGDAASPAPGPNAEAALPAIAMGCEACCPNGEAADELLMPPNAIDVEVEGRPVVDEAGHADWKERGLVGAAPGPPKNGLLAGRGAGIGAPNGAGNALAGLGTGNGAGSAKGFVGPIKPNSRCCKCTQYPGNCNVHCTCTAYEYNRNTT